MKIMIKAVIFDSGGVLHIANTSVGDDLRQELNLNDEQINKVFSYYVPLLGTGKIDEQQVWDELKRDYGIRQVNEDEHLFTRSFIATLKKMPGMYELVDGLKDIGITVMLLTNVTPQFAEVLRREGHYDPFDFRVLSYEVGIWKPDITIFEYALAQLAAKGDEVVYIDDLEKNVVASKLLGMHGILFKNTEQIKVELAKLMELPGLSS